MIYLSQMLGKPVVDATGEEIGIINDVAIATGEVFPRVTSLAFLGPDKTPFMLSWRKYVEEFDGEQITLNVSAPQIRFSYLQPDEVLLSRDLLNKQIVDTQGMKVVRVNDLKLSESRNQFRLLGAEVGMRGILRGISPALERAVARAAKLVRTQLPETIIAWNYMDLLDRDLSQVKLSVTHKRLHELHPADVADILEQLTPSQRAAVFAHLDNEAAADTISELEDELQADVIDDLSERRASDLLAEMDPDDAADIIGDLPYDKAERLLRLMGVEDASAIRGLLGYKEKTAGGIMTPEVTTVTEDMTMQQVIEHLRAESAEHESIYYVYVVEGDRHLTGVISLRDLLLASPDTCVRDMAQRDLFTAAPDDDQEDVAEQMSKYDLLALPVVDERGRILGIVTVDDALDVLEEESAEDLALATGSSDKRGRAANTAWWILRRSAWIAVYAVTLIVVTVWSIRMRAQVQEDFGPVWLAFGLAALPSALLLMPIILRTAEETSARATAEAIDRSGEDDSSPARRLLSEATLGLAVGVVVGLIGYALFDLQSMAGMTFLGGGLDRPALVFGVATMLATMLAVVVSGLLAEYARSRMQADKPLSATLQSSVAMIVSAVAYLGLAFGAAALYVAAVV